MPSQLMRSGYSESGMVGFETEPSGGRVFASGRARSHASLTMPPGFAGRPSGPTSIPGGQTGSGSNGSGNFGASDGSSATRTSQRPTATPTAYDILAETSKVFEGSPPKTPAIAAVVRLSFRRTFSSIILLR